MVDLKQDEPIGYIDRFHQKFASVKTHAAETLEKAGWTPVYTRSPEPSQAEVSAPDVRVKALEWISARVSDQWGRFTATTVFGTYEALEWSDGGFGGTMPGDPTREEVGPTDFETASIDEAKAAAQADYERRILSALSPAPSQEADGDVSRLYDANAFMADGGSHEMTAAEDVLAWLIIEKIGVVDDRNYTPNEAQAIIVRALDDVAHPPASAPTEVGGEAEVEREITLNVKAKLRLAFRRALSELPEIAPPEVASVLSSVHMQDEFLIEGKRLQREHGTEAVAPRVEQECGAGAWSFMRKGVMAAIALPPASAPTEAMVEAAKALVCLQTYGERREKLNGTLFEFKSGDWFFLSDKDVAALTAGRQA